MGKPKIASEFEVKPYRTFPLWVHYMMRKFNADKKNCYQIFGFDYVRMNAWKGSKSIPTLKSCMRLSKYLSEYTGVSKYDVLDSILESIPEWRDM
jgi:hypothetical protein